MSCFYEQYDVTYVLQRRVTITVTVPRGEDPTEYSDDELELQDGEEIIDYDYTMTGED
jgi:hypothetical protein